MTTKLMSQVIVQNVSTQSVCPDEALLMQWAIKVLRQFNSTKEVTLRVVDKDEIQRLNKDYRHQDKVTNVLSFGVDDELGIDHGVLGDVVICAAVVVDEAAEQNKQVQAHWAHMVVHGVLHLLGFDHENERDARIMEAHEIDLLATFSIGNPYQVSHKQQHRNQYV